MVVTLGLPKPTPQSVKPATVMPTALFTHKTSLRPQHYLFTNVAIPMNTNSRTRTQLKSDVTHRPRMLEQAKVLSQRCAHLATDSKITGTDSNTFLNMSYQSQANVLHDKHYPYQHKSIVVRDDWYTSKPGTYIADLEINHDIGPTKSPELLATIPDRNGDRPGKSVTTLVSLEPLDSDFSALPDCRQHHDNWSAQRGFFYTSEEGLPLQSPWPLQDSVKHGICATTLSAPFHDMEIGKSTDNKGWFIWLYFNMVQANLQPSIQRYWSTAPYQGPGAFLQPPTAPPATPSCTSQVAHILEQTTTSHEVEASAQLLQSINKLILSFSANNLWTPHIQQLRIRVHNTGSHEVDYITLHLPDVYVNTNLQDEIVQSAPLLMRQGFTPTAGLKSYNMTAPHHELQATGGTNCHGWPIYQSVQLDVHPEYRSPAYTKPAVRVPPAASATTTAPSCAPHLPALRTAPAQLLT